MEKVLIVDHDYNFGRSLKSLLSFCDIEAMYEYDEYKAIECLQYEPCDIVFIDLNMPQMRGYNLARRLIKKYPKIKIVLIAGRGLVEDYKKSQSIGVTDFLNKPINIITVVEMINQFRAENHIGASVC